MTDQDALLRAICENPDDDAPRLIYADWLDEHGDPLQAEFIRTQIELARGPNSTVRKWSLEARQQILFGQRAKWVHRFLAEDKWFDTALHNTRRGFDAQMLGKWSAAQCTRGG
jgi:uncharacterized protein (TIGR02996 family)